MPLMKGHFDLLPIPRFTNEEEVEGLSPEETLAAILSGEHRFQVGMSRKFFDLSAFLEAYVKEMLTGGVTLPNMSQNGNFTQGAPEAPEGLPNYWIPGQTDAGAAGTAPTVSVVAPPAGVGGNGVAWAVGACGAGDMRRLQQKICLQPNRQYNVGLWYKTSGSTEGAVVRIVPTTGTATSASLPATGGSWRFYPAGTDTAPHIFSTDPVTGNLTAQLVIGSVNAPTSAQTLSFAGVSFTDGPLPTPFKPSVGDMLLLCRGFVPHTYQTTNGDLTANLSAGQVVTPCLTSGVRPANSGVLAKDAASGIALEAASPGGYLRVQTSGLVELADWTAATGAASLTAGAIYYLDATDGMMTTTAPDNPQVVGQAMGTKRLLMQAPPASTGALTQPQILARISLRVF